MNQPKEMSKRQQRRAQIRRRESRGRWLWIAVVTIAAVLVAFVFIYPNFKPTAPVVAPPPITRTNVKFNTAGDPAAPIKLDEYADFQCPYCLRFYKETEAQLMSSVVADGTVYFVYHSFGEFIGPESASAAEAAYCAGDQEKFWQMHDTLFANQGATENSGAFTDRRLGTFAQNISLDMTAFNSCFTSSKYKDRIDQDAKDGLAAGVQATPSFILSYQLSGQTKTQLIEGAQGIDAFKTAVQTALTAMGK